MKDKKANAAIRVYAAFMVTALLFAAFGSMFIASAQNSLGTTIYLKTDQTQSPYIHYWYSTGVESKWPGVAMSKVRGETDLYFYDLPDDISKLNGVIFNSDGNGSKMTEDVTDITGNLYDLSERKWLDYQTSSIKITSYGGNPDSSVYTNQKVVLSMSAEGGDGKLQYKISVKGASEEVVSDYSEMNRAVWIPAEAGDYTVSFEVKDGSGDSNVREAFYTVKDSASAVEPVILGAVPDNRSQIKKGENVTVNVKGSGGNVNNNILFYKAEILDPNGNPVNIPYYTTDNKFTFNADILGTYTVYMSIQNNTVRNTTAKATYFYSCVENPSDDGTTILDVPVTGITLDKNSAELTVGESAALTAAVTPSNADDKNVIWKSSNTNVAAVSNGKVQAVGAGTAVITAKTRDGGFEARCFVTVKSDGSDIILGDFNGNGKVETDDARFVQQAALGKLNITDEQFKRSDVNGDGEITLKDAALIKQYALGVISEF